MKSHIVAFSILCMSFSANAQSEKEIVKKILTATASYKNYSVVYTSDFKFASSDDTTYVKVSSDISKKGKNFNCIYSETIGIDSLPLSKAAFDGRYLTRLYREQTYSNNDIKNKSEKNRVLSDLREMDYRSFNKTKEDLELYRLIVLDSPYAVLEYMDSSESEMVTTKIVGKYRIKVDLETGLIMQNESWVWFDGGVQYRRIILVSIIEHGNDFQSNLFSKVKSSSAYFKTKMSQDSLNQAYFKQYVLLQTGDTMPGFGARINSNKDSIDFKPLDKGIYVFDFFYTTCGPCVAAIPKLNLIDSVYGPKGVKVYGIDPYNTDWVKLPKFLSLIKVNYEILLAPFELRKLFGVTAFPTLMIIQDGIVRYVQVGYSDKTDKELARQLDILLEK